MLMLMRRLLLLVGITALAVVATVPNAGAGMTPTAIKTYSVTRSGCTLEAVDAHLWTLQSPHYVMADTTYFACGNRNVSIRVVTRLETVYGPGNITTLKTASLTSNAAFGPMHYITAGVRCPAGGWFRTVSQGQVMQSGKYVTVASLTSNWTRLSC